MEQGRNRFADAVRRVAAHAPEVARGAMKAGAALGVAVALLALPVVHAQGVSPLGQDAIGGVSKVSLEVAKAARDARVQNQLSQYYACGLVKVTKANLASFNDAMGVDKLRTAARDALDGAPPTARTSLGQNVEGIVAMARTLTMAGLSSVVDSVLSTPETKAWSGRWANELGSIQDNLAESASQARLARDLETLDLAEAEIEEAGASIGCSL